MKKPDGRSDYVIGRGKPPRHTRFKPGQSGNPHGRPKGSRSLRADVKEALQMPIVIMEGGRKRQISTQIGTVLKLREKALRGDGRALERLLELAARYNDDPAPASADQPLTDNDEAILTDYLARRAGRDAAVNPGPSDPDRDDTAMPSGKRRVVRYRPRRG